MYRSGEDCAICPASAPPPSTSETDDPFARIVLFLFSSIASNVNYSFTSPYSADPPIRFSPLNNLVHSPAAPTTRPSPRSLKMASEHHVPRPQKIKLPPIPPSQLPQNIAPTKLSRGVQLGSFAFATGVFRAAFSSGQSCSSSARAPYRPYALRRARVRLWTQGALLHARSSSSPQIPSFVSLTSLALAYRSADGLTIKLVVFSPSLPRTGRFSPQQRARLPYRIAGRPLSFSRRMVYEEVLRRMGKWSKLVLEAGGVLYDH